MQVTFEMFRVSVNSGCMFEIIDIRQKFPSIPFRQNSRVAFRNAL